MNESRSIHKNLEKQTKVMAHWVRITAWTRRGGERIESFSWEGMSFELRTKYNWYFTYRAALLQVQHPKAFIDFCWGHSLAEGKTLLHALINRSVARKRKISEIKRKLELARLTWCDLFPIEDDPLYQKAVLKLERQITELKELNSQIATQNKII